MEDMLIFGPKDNMLNDAADSISFLFQSDRCIVIKHIFQAQMKELYF